MHDDATRWDERYRDSQLATPRPPDALIARPDLLERIPRSGTALDVACGTGAQTLWLAQRGLQVTAIDISPVAIARTAAAAARAGIDSVDAVVADLDEGLDGLGDLDDLAVVVCQRFRDPNLNAQLIDRLGVDGVAIVTVLSEVGCDGSPGPFHAPAGELRAAFSHADLELLHHSEGDGSATVVALKRR